MPSLIIYIKRLLSSHMLYFTKLPLGHLFLPSTIVIHSLGAQRITPSFQPCHGSPILGNVVLFANLFIICESCQLYAFSMFFQAKRYFAGHIMSCQCYPKTSCHQSGSSRMDVDRVLHVSIPSAFPPLTPLAVLW